MICKVYDDNENGVPYFPDYMHNRELEDEDSEKICIWIIPMTKSAMDQINAGISIKMSKKNKEIKSNAHELQRKVALRFIKKFAGLRFEIRGTLREPLDGGDFYDHADPELIDDVLKAIEDRAVLDEGKKTV